MMKNKELIISSLLFFFTGFSFGQTQQKDMGQTAPPPIKSSIADSMRRVGMGNDTSRALMYNKNAKPMDSISQSKHNRNRNKKKGAQLHLEPHKD